MKSSSNIFPCLLDMRYLFMWSTVKSFGSPAFKERLCAGKSGEKVIQGFTFFNYHERLTKLNMFPIE